MFIFNVNLNKKNIKKFTITLALIVVALFFICIISAKLKNSKKIYVTDGTPVEDYIQIPVANYTNILKDSYENLDKYVREKN